MKRKTIFACIISLLLVICLLSGCGQSVPADDTSDKVTEKSEADKNELLLVEAWETKRHQQVHVEQPHMARLREIKDDYIQSTVLGEFELKK